MRQSFPAAENLQQRAERGPVKKAKHRVVELVVADADVIHIVRQADDETTGFRHRRNFDQRNRLADDQVAEQGDVDFKRGQRRVFRRLAHGEQVADF